MTKSFSLRATSLPSRAPATLYLRTSSNGSSFVTSTARSGVTWTSGETRVFQIAQLRTSRYIDVYMSSQPSGGDGIYELSEIAFHELVDAPDMALVSVAFDTAVAPTRARVSLQVATMHLPITLNTHLIAEASRDNGVTWTSGPLVFVEALADGLDICEAAIDLAGQPAGTQMRYRVRTRLGAYVRVGGVVFQWGV